MKKIVLLLISLFLYILSFMSLGLYLTKELSSTLSITIEGKIIFLLLGYFFFFIASTIFSSILNSKYKKYIMKTTFLLFFIIYIILLINLLFFDETFGRIGFTSNYNYIKEYIQNSYNLIPFKTINAYLTYNVSAKVLYTNVFGNFIVLIPLSFFVIVFSNKKIRFTTMLLSSILIPFIIEIIQILTQTGIFDVDDIILNGTGMLISFIFFNLKIIKKIINKITGLNIYI